MTREQLNLVLRLKEIKDPQSMSMLLQFLSLLQTKDQGGPGSGLLGLPQFLSFLGKSQEDNMPSSARSSVPPSPRPPSSTLPRPANRRKSSIGKIGPPTSFWTTKAKIYFYSLVDNFEGVNGHATRHPEENVGLRCTAPVVSHAQLGLDPVLGRGG